MKIQVGTTMNGRTVNLEVDSDEGKEVFPNKWESWNVAKRFKMLSTYADSLIVKYLIDAHMITPEQGFSRMAALQELLKS